MKLFQNLSIRNLKRCKEFTFIVGLSLLAVIFFIPSLMFKIVLSLLLLFMCWKGKQIDNVLKQKSKYRRRYLYKKDMSPLQDECIVALKQLENIFIQKGYDKEKGENRILDRLYYELNQCKYVTDYNMLKEKIERRIIYVSNATNNEKARKRTFNRDKQVTSTTILSHSLQVLELPEDTTDMVIIKNAYKNLIKKYHPDINSSMEAGEKTIQLNLAYEQLKRNIEAS